MNEKIYGHEWNVLRRLLKEVRVEAGLRQEDVAAALEKPQSYVSKYEAGERRLDLLEVRDVCAVIGITLAEFVERLERELG